MRRFGIICCICIAGCVKPYSPHLNNPPTGYLVVEGNINAGAGPSTIILSRSVPLTDTASEVFEEGATVALEGSDGTTYASAPGANGTYTFGALPLDTTKTYRLDIHTAGDVEYQSDYVHVIPNPPIDSISIMYKGTDGVYVNVNTHNPSDNTRYYQWSYSETWEYNSAEYSSMEFDPVTDTVIVRPPGNQIFTCWKGDSSTDILIYTSTKLSHDVVSEFPLTFIAEGDQRLSVEYSINVHQYALSADCYNYLLLMQSNTENLGSIFDPLPSNLKGNIHCVSDPSQTVVGFVNVSSEQTLRIFARRPPYWPYIFTCPEPDTIVPSVPKGLYTWFFTGIAPVPPINTDHPPMGIYVPIEMNPMGPGWVSNLIECVDCRQLGGTTTQPWFWQ
ncbi:MAG TPA: DUF4249 domain-containing protein [Dinghuibacter sp.]|jgi:hypothetical protein|uniref:DUF4249 domain-containing protein n=1 Tax=Dinghuibacter sp. TaxID=2024697 RepID=UPI002C5522D8|nr:DUF4249 domain-containing protein [Dinghuibacter sp.]HTJ12093.1 DUF4249 domain-containing protein [Dinghuibacter sp.]